MANEKLIEIKNKDAVVGCLGTLSITAEEREIAMLIDAARQQGILTKAERYGSTPYFAFTLGESGSKYTVCFGCDPDRGVYPRAERALRASRFVDGLLKIVNATYNCYAAVPEQIKPPARSAVLRRVFGGADGIELGAVKEQSRGAGDENYRTAYELEMVVIVAFGNKYERINECVTVELDAQNNATYTYGSITQKTTSGSMPLTEAQKQESIRDANRIRDKVQADGEKKKILMALSAAEESRFRRFMDALDEKDSRFIGQVDIHPCFVFVDAIPERTFLYDVEDGANKGAELLRITWNKEPRKFASAPLYIRTAHEGGQIRFHGLTHSPKGETDGEGELLTFDPDEKLVPVYHYDPRSKDARPVGMSLLLDAGYTDKSYKGMNDWGVPVDGVSAKLMGDRAKVAQGYRYYRSETVTVGEKRYLKADVVNCAYTGNPVWQGDLTAFDVDFLDKNGEFAKGRIDRSLIRDKNKRFCVYCGKGKNGFEFFADDERYERYRRNKKYLLWDGTCKCPKCKEGVLITEGSRTKRKLITAYDPAESESRQVFAYWDATADAPVAVPEGNVYRCAHSGNFIYYDREAGANQLVPCDTCGQPLSPKSYQGLLKNANMRQINGHLYCRSCLQDKDKRLYKDVYLPNGQKGVLVDAAGEPASLVTCECGKLLYKQAQGFPRCECDACTSSEQGENGQHEKVYLCTSCWSNRPRSKFLNKRLCDACAAYERSNAGLMQAERNRAKAAQEKAVDTRKQKKELEARYKTLAGSWEQTVWENMEKYLPYLGFADALCVRRARKQWRAALRTAQDAVKWAEDSVARLKRRMEALGAKEDADVLEVRRLQAELDAAVYVLGKARREADGKKRMPVGVIAVNVPEDSILEVADPKHPTGEGTDVGELYLSFTLRVRRGSMLGRKYEFLYENGKVTYVEVKA